MRQVRRGGVVALALSASVMLCASAQACTKTWVAASGDWTIATAWSPAGVPAPTDDVCLPASSTYIVTVPAIAGGGAFVHSFAIGGVGPGQPTLEIRGASVPSNGVTQQYAALTATTGGTIATNGRVELDATDGGATATPGEQSGGEATLAGGTIANAGTILALSESKNGLRDHLRAPVTNQITGVLQIGNGFLDIDNGATFQNLGTVLANGAGNWLITANPALGGAPSRVINSGTVTTSGGVEVLDAGWTQAGGAVNGAPVGIQDSLLDYEAGSGSFTFFPDADATPSRLAGTIPMGATVSVDGGTVQLQAPQVTSHGTLRLTPGARFGAAELTGAPLMNEGAVEVSASPTGRTGASYLRVDLTNTGTFGVESGAVLVQDAGTLFENDFILALDPGSRYVLSSGASNDTSSRLASSGRDSQLAFALGTRPTGMIDVGPGGRLDEPAELGTLINPDFAPFPGRIDRAIENTGGTINGQPGAFATGAIIRISANGSVAFRFGTLASAPRATRGGFALTLTCPPVAPACGRVTVVATALAQVWQTIGKGSRRFRVPHSVPVVVGSASLLPLPGTSPVARVRLNARGRALLAGRRTLAVTVSVASRGHSLLHTVIHVRRRSRGG